MLLKSRGTSYRIPMPSPNELRPPILPFCPLRAVAPLSSFLSVMAVHFAKEKSMSAEAARRAPIMSLSELVRLYRVHAGDFGQPVALSAFQLSTADTHHLCSACFECVHFIMFVHCSASSRHS